MTGDGVAPVYKFCQKARPDEAEPSTVAITNMHHATPAQIDELSGVARAVRVGRPAPGSSPG